MIPEHLRPLRMTEVVDGGFALARRAIPRTVPLTLAAIAPVELVVWWGQHAILEGTGERGVTVGSVRFENLASVMVGALQLVALAIAVAVCTPVTVAGFAGEAPERWRAVLLRVVRRSGGIVFVLFVGALVVLPAGLVLGAVFGAVGIFVFGFGLAFVGGAAVVGWFGVTFGPLAFMVALYAPVLPAMFAENLPAPRAVARGFRLSGRRLFANTAAILVMFGVAMVAWISLQLLLALLLRNQTVGAELWDTGISVLLGTAVTVIVAPAFAGVISAIYFDARVRREGLDLSWALWDLEAA